MKISQTIVFAAAFLAVGAVAADEETDANAPIELSAAQMDQITAGSLTLNNGTGGKVIFGGFDNPAPSKEGYLSAALGDLCTLLDPDFCHPALTRRSDTALDATFGKGPFVGGGSNDGPWAATVASPVISCNDCP